MPIKFEKFAAISSGTVPPPLKVASTGTSGNTWFKIMTKRVPPYTNGKHIINTKEIISFAFCEQKRFRSLLIYIYTTDRKKCCHV